MCFLRLLGFFCVSVYNISTNLLQTCMEKSKSTDLTTKELHNTLSHVMPKKLFDTYLELISGEFRN